jgi:hypothetical protein
MIDKGAHFYRCDLQVHTPRDINWTGIDRIRDPDRRTYAGHLVQADSLACHVAKSRRAALSALHPAARVLYSPE